MTRGWPDEEGWRKKRRKRGRRTGGDTLLETRRFAGTLSIGVLTTPTVNILPLTNPPGGPWVVLLTEKGRRIVQSERIERMERSGRTRDGARGTLERERAEGPTKIARLSRGREKERRGSSEKGEEGGCLCARGRRRCRRQHRRRRRRHSPRRRPAGCCVRAREGGWALPSDRASYPILSSRCYPILTWLSLA